MKCDITGCEGVSPDDTLCPGCDRVACAEHRGKCLRCGRWVCSHPASASDETSCNEAQECEC